METTLSKMIGMGAFFLAVFASGFWLSHSGKPYGVILFNLHKLIGLAAAVFLGITAYNAAQVAPLQAGQIASLVATAVFFLLTIVAGGLVSVLAEGGLASFTADLKTLIGTAHKVLPYLAVLSTALTLYLFYR